MAIGVSAPERRTAWRLVGPVEIEQRPIVAFREVAFDPKTRTFAVAFARGGAATLKMAAIDQSKHVLDVALDTTITGKPFAALRSMYVTEFNNDVARIGLREKGKLGWTEKPIMAFEKANATDVWAGRTTISRHNTSSPDMVLKDFQGK